MSIQHGQRVRWGGLVLAALLGASQAVNAQDLYISNARVLDVGARQERTRNVLIRAGVIAAFPDSKPADFSGPVFDAGGRWVMPALSDMHTHAMGNFQPPDGYQFLGPDRIARAMLYAGVGRFLDLHNMERLIFAARARRDSAATPAAEIFAAGACLTATNGHCTEYGVPVRLVDSPADAQREVNELAGSRPDVVKVVYDHQLSMPTIDRATLEAAVAAARANGLRTVVHIGTWEDMRHAVLAGAEVVTHTPKGHFPAELPGLLRERGTFFIPTLVVHEEGAHLIDDRSLLDSPLLAEVAGQELLTRYRSFLNDSLPTEITAMIEQDRRAFESNAEAVRTFAAAGVPLVTGTDAGSPALFQGYTVHRELRLLVEAGVPVWEVLAATTVNAGRLVNRKWGTDIGDEATLLVLEASPLDDIRNSQRIHAVILRGMVVDRGAIRPFPNR